MASQPEQPKIVGIGASAGGVRALQRFFESLPDDTGAAFVVVVHLDPEHQSELANIIGQRTKMAVTQVAETAPLKPNEVYVIPPGRRLEITDTAVSALSFNEPRGQRAPIELFFRSLANQHGDGFAVVLTGGGSDGSIGVRAVKETGGIVLVQDPDEAEYASMPRAAIATGVADFVLPLAEIGPRLAELIERKAELAHETLDAKGEDSAYEIADRLRQQTHLVEIAHAPIFTWEIDGGILTWNRGCEELYGYTKAEALGRRVNELLKTRIPAGGPTGVVPDALRKQGSWSGELRHTTKEGRELAVEAFLQLERVGDSGLVLESTRDVTETKALVARQRLLLDELTHRVRNTLTIVQAIAHQTVRGSASADEFVKAFDGRLLALSAAHKLLVESEWAGAELRALAEGQLAHFRDPHRERIMLDGEDVRLPAAFAMPFGLMLHELASNAAKYGALSKPGGRIAVTWHVAGDRNGARRLTVVWQEHDGPKVNPPARGGFGSTLIQRGIPGAKVNHEFRPEGVVCTIELTLPGGTTDDMGTERSE